MTYMNDEQRVLRYKAHIWLSRMWGKEKLIDAKIKKRDQLSSWGVGTYDAQHVPGGADQNPDETKLINYTQMSEEIDKDIQEYIQEMRRTEKAIGTITDTLLQGILYDFYINNKSAYAVRKKYHYSKTRFYELKTAAIDKALPAIPTNEVDLDD